MVIISPRWSKMARCGPKWSTKLQMDPIQSKKVQQLSKLIPYDPIWSKINQYGQKWHKTVQRLQKMKQAIVCTFSSHQDIFFTPKIFDLFSIRICFIYTQLSWVCWYIIRMAFLPDLTWFLFFMLKSLLVKP